MTVLEKICYCLSFVIVLILMCFIIFSDKGMLDFKALKQEESLVRQQVEKIDDQTWKIEDEIISLKTDLEYIRHVAKHEHDMVEEDELIFKDQSAKKRETP